MENRSEDYNVNASEGTRGRIITAALLVLFSIMFIYGTKSGEMDIVIQKAINICLECIGIG